VSFIVKKLAEIWGPQAVFEIDPNPQPHEAHFLKLDSSKATARLGWRPRWNIDQALRETVLWYQSYASRESRMHDFSLQQIAKYAEACALV
jgi:CDP-glucose 4,6-dehydratase